jgi:hypothetical protein
MTLQEFPAASTACLFAPVLCSLGMKAPAFLLRTFFTAEILVSNMLQSHPLAAFALFFTAVVIEGAQYTIVVKTGFYCIVCRRKKLSSDFCLHHMTGFSTELC